MCGDHFVRLTDEHGERQYVCTICAEIQLGAYVASAPTSTPSAEALA